MKTSSTTIGLLLFLACMCPLKALAADYSLGDLYRIALERSEKVQLARENVDFARLEKNRAIAMLMPKLTAFTSYQQYTDDKRTELGTLIQPKSAGQWGLRADQTMSLSLREFTALSEARNDITRAGYDLSSVKEAYLLHVARSYYEVLMARKGLDIATSNLERITRYREAAAARLKVGEATKTVLLRADSELSGAKSDMVRARNLLTLAQSALARVAGIEGDYTLKEEPFRVANEAPLAELKNTAYAERPDLRSLEEQVRIWGQEVSYARGAYWPNLSVAGVYQNNAQTPKAMTFNDDSTYGAVALSFPFFEGGLRVAEVQEAKVRERQARLQYDDLKKTVGMDVESAFLDLTTRRGQLRFLEDQAAFARDNYRGVSRQFELGLASSIDVIDANNLLVSSERQLAEAMYSYQLSILSLEQATGTFMREVEGSRNR
jgi:outer membrane protein